MDKETLLELRKDLDVILKGAGVKPDQIKKLSERLDKASEEKGRKMMTIDVLKELFRPVFNEEQFFEAIKQIKIANEVVVNPPQIIVKGSDTKMIKTLAKELADALQKQPASQINVSPPKVTVKASDIKIPKKFQIIGFNGLIKIVVAALKVKWWEQVNNKNPLAVTLVHRGKNYKAGEGKDGEFVGIMGGPSRIYVRNKDNTTADLVESATTMTAFAVTLAVVDTEYSQVLPNGTRRYKVYLVDSGRTVLSRNTLKYGARSLGDSDWSSDDFILVPGGNYDEDRDLNLTGVTLYFNTPDGAGDKVIIKVWS